MFKTPLPNHLCVFAFCLLASILLFANLGSREIWTQEWRWGEIVRWMLLQKDYFHPTLAGQLYFDKPLLSYWLMAGVAKLAGLSTFSIRLPSAIAGLVSIFCLYQIGSQWLQRQTGTLAAVMLGTTYYFIFWARTASTDALNLAGVLCTVAWYFTKRKEFSLINSSIFFLLLAITALLKGLIGIILVFIIIAPDTVLRFKNYCRWEVFLSILAGILLYLLPFFMTHIANDTSLSESGLYQVYRENILRFFEPFDHKEPLYTYFVYLPIYLLPWTFFFFAALYQLPMRWVKLTPSTKQLIFANIGLFAFLTLSGSRRSYYILPQVPFALLFIAEWLVSLAPNVRNRYVNYTAGLSFCFFFAWFVIFQPWYYGDGGLPLFSKQLICLMQKSPANKTRLIFFNADNRLSFYLPDYKIDFLKPEELKKLHLLFTKESRSNTILVTREAEIHQIQNQSNYQILRMQLHRGNRWFKNPVLDAPVAFIALNNDKPLRVCSSVTQQNLHLTNEHHL
jgi:4-amino-4-deoxy-L-arabinose transferase-like glycosyltransferase